MAKLQTFKTYDSYLWAFKRLLVCSYIWGVDDAAQFQHDYLRVCYDEGMTDEEAYTKIFGKAQYGYEYAPPKPIL
jgi:hypothetical protein